MAKQPCKHASWTSPVCVSYPNNSLVQASDVPMASTCCSYLPLRKYAGQMFFVFSLSLPPYILLNKTFKHPMLLHLCRPFLWDKKLSGFPHMSCHLAHYQFIVCFSNCSIWSHPLKLRLLPAIPRLCGIMNPTLN